MLGAYNVDGAPCELLVEQDALTWWPKSWPAATTTGASTDGSGAPAAATTTTTTSPLKHHLRRLSNASSVIFNNISQLGGAGGGGGSDNDNDKTSDTQQQQQQQQQGNKIIDRTKNKRRIEFGQIVGLKPILHHHTGSEKSTATGGRHQVRSDSSEESKTTNSDESSQASQREQQQQQPPTENEMREKPPVSGQSNNFSKFKLYYVKRNEKKASSRLLKLKKITIGLLPSVKSSQATVRHHDTHDRENSNSSSIENSPSESSCGTMASTCGGQCHSAIASLYEQIEQYLELVRRQRPKRLLVFVNPFGGKGRALHLYKSKVRKVLELAQVECELVVTRYANHARETIEDPQYDLSQFDGIICIGGDGMFAELMNGLLFRCNRDKLLASELSSLNKRLSDSFASSRDDSTDLECSISEAVAAGAQQYSQQLHSNSLKQQHDKRNNRQAANSDHHDTSHSLSSSTASSVGGGGGGGSGSDSHSSSSSLQTTTDCDGQRPAGAAATGARSEQQQQQLKFLRSSLGGIGEQFVTPNIPIGVIGAGSTDANLFGFIGTNDTVSATLNIVLGNQIQIDVCSIHSIQDDRLMRFVSTFVAYGYFGDVIRESEKLRWLGPSRYDLTALNSLIKYRHYQGLVRILRSSRDGTPLDLSRCHLNCRLCGQQQAQQAHPVSEETTHGNNNNNNNHQPSAKLIPSSFSFDELALAKLRACDEAETAAGGANNKHVVASADELAAVDNNRPSPLDDCDQFEIVEAEGPFVGVNAAVTACRCPQTRKGFSPGNHLANGCADLILVRPCSRMQYINYLIRTGYTKKSAFDLKYVDAYRCRQFEFIAQPPRPTRGRRATDGGGGGGGGGDENGATNCSSWNADGEILREESLRVKVNNRLVRVFGTGEPQRRAQKHAHRKG